MKNKRFLALALLVLMLCVALASCGNKPESNVKSYVKSIGEAKNLEYTIKIYRKNHMYNDKEQIFRSETKARQGKIQLDPLSYSEFYVDGDSKYDYFGGTGEYALADKRYIEEALTTYGSSDSLFNKDKYYAPNDKELYKASSDYKSGKWNWKVADPKEHTVPEIGNKEAVLKLYEKYADKFVRTEKNDYVFLEFKGDVTKDIDDIKKLQGSFVKSNLYKEKSLVKSIDIKITLVMKKEGSFGKLIPCEAIISTDTKLESTKENWKMNNEDHFEIYYKNINDTEVKPFSDFDKSKIETKK
ncbi:MAG: hypothetical protein HXL88_04545 [[Eubacterium] sulci]|nr:hypothetical protein [[Eubacterium] sulci]